MLPRNRNAGFEIPEVRNYVIRVSSICDYKQWRLQRLAAIFRLQSWGETLEFR